MAELHHGPLSFNQSLLCSADPLPSSRSPRHNLHAGDAIRRSGNVKEHHPQQPSRAWASSSSSLLRCCCLSLLLGPSGMVSPSLETRNVGSYIYSSLGSHRLGKDVKEAPPVLPILSSLLERAVHRDEKLLGTINKKESTTVFHGLRVPSLSIERYFERIFKYANCSLSCLVLAHIYIDRYLQQPDAYLTSLNVHRLLITSVVVAAKFNDDAFFSNAYYARVGGISKYELNRLELNLLFNLDFRLHVTVETFGRYCLQLEKEASTSVCQVERHLRVCGLNDWTNKEEVKGQRALQNYSCGAV